MGNTLRFSTEKLGEWQNGWGGRNILQENFNHLQAYTSSKKFSG